MNDLTPRSDNRQAVLKNPVEQKVGKKRNLFSKLRPFLKLGHKKNHDHGSTSGEAMYVFTEFSK